MALIVTVALILCGHSDLWANANQSEKLRPLPGADALFDYAWFNFENKDYETAIIELKRFLYFYPNDPRAARASYHLGISYLRLKKYDQAVNAFQKTIETYPDDEFAIESRFQISRCQLQMNNPDEGAGGLINLIKETDQPAVKDRARYRLGWIAIETGRIGQASTWFNRISPNRQTDYQVAELQKDMARIKDLPQKRPFLAGLFSVIPGGGYLYTGRYQDAAVAFVVNAALMGAAYESFDNDLEVLGGLLALIDAGFYAGSIYGGISSAHKFNRSAYNQYIENLKETHQGGAFSAIPARSGIKIAFTWRF
ncbi:MAG: tetratricopeptide repeat protein [Desulfobacterales bacterium]|nr:tetratricopeptide repeat protein [Desulfobacterales bacterium]